MNDPRQNYSCADDGRLNDPYEGELFTWWLQFFGGLSENDKQMLWEVKRFQLVSVEYKMGGVGPITVQEGLYFRACLYGQLLICDQDIGFQVTSSGRCSKCPITMLTSLGRYRSLRLITVHANYDFLQGGFTATPNELALATLL